VVDSSGLLAFLDRGERDHRAVRRLVAAEPGPLVVTDFVLAEVDYMVLTRLGRSAERAFIRQLVEGVLFREPVSDPDLRRAQEIVRRYADKAVGLTDASLMAVAERLGAKRILTLDLRHFAEFRDRKGAAFEIVPGDVD
jgi:predicted nucleic acid-binding protein